MMTYRFFALRFCDKTILKPRAWASKRRIGVLELAASAPTATGRRKVAPVASPFLVSIQKRGVRRKIYGLQAVMTQIRPRGVRTAHSVSAIFLAAACDGDQPSPQAPVVVRAMQYHSADAAVDINEMALSARSEQIIVRMVSPQFSKGVKTAPMPVSNIAQ
jgi:hypothetical protein